jgi:K+-sensing histidine kinase KdpD
VASPPTEPSALALLQQRILDLEEENRALRGLAEQRSSRNALFIDISHELRTPLTLSIAPLEELLTRGGDLDGETRQGFLETIYNNQLRLLRLINDLLDLARVDAGRVDATFQLADVASALRPGCGASPWPWTSSPRAPRCCSSSTGGASRRS